MIRRPAASAPVWTLRSPHRGTVQDLMRKHDVPELVAILLANRGYSPGEAVSAHMAPDLRKLHDPFLLPNMREATRVLRKSVEDGETILIHGDYDVDGVTGTVLLVRLLRLFGADVHWHIPDRFKDGYSFGDHSIERAKAEGAKLVISVDNGTSAIEPIAQLKAIGVKTIVTDHHEPPVSGLPEAVAIVNPKLRDSTYPFPELCGGAVAFKLAWGFCQEMSDGDRVKPELRQFLVDSMGDVAIATVCDVVPLVDENRILARHGLKALESSSRPGVKALLSAAGISNRALNAEDVSFQIGPRINASGRLATAARAVEVLARAGTKASSGSSPPVSSTSTPGQHSSSASTGTWVAVPRARSRGSRCSRRCTVEPRSCRGTAVTVRRPAARSCRSPSTTCARPSAKRHAGSWAERATHRPSSRSMRRFR